MKIASHNHVAAGLGCRVRTIGRVWSLLREKAGLAKASIYLISGNVKEAIFFFSALELEWGVHPTPAGYIQHGKCSQHIRADKSLRSGYRIIHMRLGSKMNHPGDPVFVEEAFNQGPVQNIPFYKNMTLVFFQFAEVVQFARVSECIQVYHLGVVVL